MKKNYVALLLLILMPALGKAQHRYADSLTLALHRAPNDSVRYLINMQIAYYFQELERDSSLRYYDAALQLASKNNQNIAKAGILGIKGYELSHMGRYSESLQLFQDAFKLIDESKNDQNGWYFSQGGAKPKNNRLFMLSRLQVLYSVLMHITNNVNQELFYLEESLKNAKLVNDAYRMAIAEINLSTLYLSLNKLDSAMIRAHEALNNLRYSTDKKYMATALSVIGYVYMKKGNLPLQHLYLSESLKWAIKTNHLAAMSRAYFGLTNYYLAKAVKDSSVFCARKALQVIRALPVGSKDFDIDEGYQNLSIAFRLDHQPDSVMKYQAIALAAKDSVYKKRIKNLADFQNFGFHQQLHLKDVESERLAYQSRTRVYTLLAGIGVLMLLAGIFYRNNRQKQKANVLLNQQKEEIQQALSQLKATQNQLIQAEKMASLGELTAGIAHEIQNPLNFVNNFSEINREMLEELDEELNIGDIAGAKEIAANIKQNEEKISHHGKRADAIVKGMLEHSRVGTGHKELTDINKLVDEYLRLAYHGLRAKDKYFNTALILQLDDKLPPILIISQDIGRVLLNLFNNAFYAVNERKKTAGTDYQPEVTVSTSAQSDGFIIKVKDNGAGIPNAIKDKIMQPFFTTKPTGEGTGLGLSLSYDIVVKGHGGNISVESKEGGYTQFTVILPII